MKTVINLNIYVHWHVETAQINQSVLQPVASDITLLGVLNQQRQRLETCRSTSTMANYRTAIQSLSQYLDGDIPLHEFNADLLCGYERWLRQKGICLNTISCYMRSLRSLMVASKQRFMDAFKKVYTGNSSTEKRSVPIGSVLRLKNLPLSPGSFEELARDVFLFSFYAMGMPFVDVAHLKMSQIEDRHFSYKRQKTGQGIVVTSISTSATRD